MARTSYNPYERNPVNINSNEPILDKFILGFDLDFSNINSDGEVRDFNIIGDDGAEFMLEVKDNTTNYYYNFISKTFVSSKASLHGEIIRSNYKNSITFPAVTGSSDKYDIYLYAKPGTRHAAYEEVRFEDSSLDINSSNGSNSLMMQKVLYQYEALSLSINSYSPNSTVKGTFTPVDISVERGKSKDVASFSITATALPSSFYRILKQPETTDLLSLTSVTISADPEDLPGENIYPTATDAFTGDDVNGAITSGTVVRIDGSTSANIKVGDKITATVSTGTIDGAIADGDDVVMDQDVATIMAVGDQITGDGCVFANSNLVTVTAINVGGNVKKFTASVATQWLDGRELTFSSKVNRDTTTVTVVATSGADTDFTMSQAIQFRDNQALTFTPRRNKRWSVDNVLKLSTGDLIVEGDSITSSSTIANYEDEITVAANTDKERKIIKNSAPAIDSKSNVATIVDGVKTTQAGSIIFNNQQALSLGGKTISVINYGEDSISKVYGYDVLFTNLSVSLTPITTTTTSSVSSSTTVPVASVNGIMPSTSTISGIGIDSYSADPTVQSRSVTSGAGDLILSAAQTLESGVTLTSSNAGQVATITGNIEILKGGTEGQTIYFDLERLLSTT